MQIQRGGGGGGGLDNVIIKYQDLMCWQRRLWRVCIFAQTRLSPHHITETSCAGSNGDLCTGYVSSEGCCESAPATRAHMCNHLSVVSMRQKCPQCLVIKFLLKFDFFSLVVSLVNESRFFLPYYSDACHISVPVSVPLTE